MATIRKRVSNKTISWNAQIRRKGFPAQAKTFKSHAAAKAWANKIETEMDNGSWIAEQDARSTFIDDLAKNLIHSFERFGITVEGPKRSSIDIISKYFKGVSLHDLTYEDVSAFAEERLKTVQGSTLQQQLYYFRQMITNSRIHLKENVVEDLIADLTQKKVIHGSEYRERRLESGEYEALMEACTPGQSYMKFLIDWAIASAMRQGEIHAMKSSDFFYGEPDSDTLCLGLWRKDKSVKGGKRYCVIPVLPQMQGVLNFYGHEIQSARHRRTQKKLKSQKLDAGSFTHLKAIDRQFCHLKVASSISDTFAKIRKQAGIVDLTFHDLRHEALSQMFNVHKMRVEEVKVMSGHRSLDQLSRYVNIKPEEVTLVA